jgi:hypothetical protein
LPAHRTLYHQQVGTPDTVQHAYTVKQTLVANILQQSELCAHRTGDQCIEQSQQDGFSIVGAVVLAWMDKGRHARLQRKHALLLRLAHDLSLENIQLRRKEKVMISLLAEQVIGW